MLRPKRFSRSICQPSPPTLSCFKPKALSLRYGRALVTHSAVAGSMRASRLALRQPNSPRAFVFNLLGEPSKARHNLAARATAHIRRDPPTERNDQARGRVATFSIGFFTDPGEKSGVESGRVRCVVIHSMA